MSLIVTKAALSLVTQAAHGRRDDVHLRAHRNRSGAEAKLGADPDFADALVMAIAPGGLTFSASAGDWAP